MTNCESIDTAFSYIESNLKELEEMLEFERQSFERHKGYPDSYGENSISDFSKEDISRLNAIATSALNLSAKMITHLAEKNGLNEDDLDNPL